MFTAAIATHWLMLKCGFKTPTEWTTQYIINFSLTFIFFGAFLRFLNQKYKLYPDND